MFSDINVANSDLGEESVKFLARGGQTSSVLKLRTAVVLFEPNSVS